MHVFHLRVTMIIYRYIFCDFGVKHTLRVLLVTICTRCGPFLMFGIHKLMIASIKFCDFEVNLQNISKIDVSTRKK